MRRARRGAAVEVARDSEGDGLTALPPQLEPPAVAPGDAARLGRMYRRWRAYDQAADRAWRAVERFGAAWALERAERLSVASDALATELTYALAEVSEGEPEPDAENAGDAVELEPEPDCEASIDVVLARACERFRRDHVRGLGDQDRLARELRAVLGGVLRPDVSDAELLAAAGDAWRAARRRRSAPRRP